MSTKPSGYIMFAGVRIPYSEAEDDVIALEADNARLRALLNRISTEPLSASWHHLSCVTTPPPRTMPARAMAFSKQKIGIR